MSQDMNNRIIAVQYDREEQKETASALVQALTQQYGQDSVVVFRKNGVSPLNAGNVKEVELDASIDNSPKIKNSIFDYASSSNLRGFLHIIEGNVVIQKDPTQFISAVEHTMDVLDYSIYFSTVTDGCNYVYKKFNPRLTISMDDDIANAKLMLPSTLSFTSHSNTCWTVYDFNKMPNGPQRYEEKFSIPMYYIIEYLARRRASKQDGQLYFMNQYLSIPEEIGVFSYAQVETIEPTPEQMKAEDTLFKEMNVEYAPDNNIDIVLEAVYQKINEKLKQK